jgi:hypothetical protein
MGEKYRTLNPGFSLKISVGFVHLKVKLLKFNDFSRDPRPLSFTASSVRKKESANGKWCYFR